MNIYRAVVVDDHQIFRSGLIMLLNDLMNVKVVAEASNGFEFLEYIEDHDIELVFMDIKMPKMDGVEATSKALRKNKNLKIIALTMFDDLEYFYSMIEAGVEGFLLKNTERDEIQKAVNIIVKGENYFSEVLLNKISENDQINTTGNKPKYNSVKLTNREFDVLHYICKGYSNSEIADQLFISQRTVQGHRANLISKTGAKNSIDLVMYAVRNKLIKI